MKFGWQLELSHWESIPDDLRNSKSWVEVDYTSIGRLRVPDHPGVYMFCVRPVGIRRETNSKTQLFGKLFTPIYIGQTTNLHRRFVQHCQSPSRKLKSAVMCFGDSINFWFHKRNVDQIKVEESWLISCFGPSANEVSGSIRAKLGNPVPVGQ